MSAGCGTPHTWRGEARRPLMLDVTRMAPRCACSTLLGAALSQQQPGRRCWCCRACEGASNQPHTDCSLLWHRTVCLAGRGEARIDVEVMPIAPRCACSYLLVAALSLSQPDRRCITAELAKALSTNSTLTRVCTAWHNARWEERTLCTAIHCLRSLAAVSMRPCSWPCLRTT